MPGPYRIVPGAGRDATHPAANGCEGLAFSHPGISTRTLLLLLAAPRWCGAIDLALGKRECQGGEHVLDERKLAVLRAIVEAYVSTNEPVGSKSLVDRHNLDVSPATIRNDMAVLEEQGYIGQPHPSAGRIPTDQAYRLFVDRLSAIKPFTVAERRAIETFLAGA